MDLKVHEQGRKNSMLGMELNAYKNELMLFKDLQAKQKQFVVLKIGTLKNMLVTIAFKKQKKKFSIIMESKSHVWEIPLTSVI